MKEGRLKSRTAAVIRWTAVTTGKKVDCLLCAMQVVSLGVSATAESDNASAIVQKGKTFQVPNVSSLHPHEKELGTCVISKIRKNYFDFEMLKKVHNKE